MVLGLVTIIFSSLVFGYWFVNRNNDSNLQLPLEENNMQEQTNLENTTNLNEMAEEQTPSNNEDEEDKNYIKWFEFKVSYDVLVKTSQLDINSHTKNEAIKYNWTQLISYLACKYGNDFSKFKQADLDALVSKLKNGETMEEITKNMKLYSYYYEGYSAVLSQFIGNYEVQKPNTTNKNSSTTNNAVTIEENSLPFTQVYGIKAFHPLAQNYSYSHYDDFGNSRSYGYKRLHLGNDLMGSIGTPVIAVESGIIEAVRLEPIWWLAYWYTQF